MHARASAKFVRVVEEYSSQVDVTRGDMTVSGDSIMGLLMLTASNGTDIHVVAKGSDAKEVCDALQDLVEGKFDEGF